jgi:hypothetical protein
MERCAGKLDENICRYFLHFSDFFFTSHFLSLIYSHSLPFSLSSTGRLLFPLYKTKQDNLYAIVFSKCTVYECARKLEKQTFEINRRVKIEKGVRFNNSRLEKKRSFCGTLSTTTCDLKNAGLPNFDITLTSYHMSF